MRNILIDKNDLYRLFDAYEAATGIQDKTLSNRVFKDSKKISLMREGKEITTERWNQAVQWFADNWPENATWPSDIERPKVTPAPPPPAEG